MFRFTLLASLFVSPLAFAAEPPPGTTIAHSPAKSKQYIGSPSIAVLPSGEYVASHDLFMAGDNGDRTHVYASKDKGKSWTHRTRSSASGGARSSSTGATST